MLHTANQRWPRVLIGLGNGLSKCTKCGLAFVAKQPTQHTCSKCSDSRKQSTRRTPYPGQAAKPVKRPGHG